MTDNPEKLNQRLKDSRQKTEELFNIIEQEASPNSIPTSFEILHELRVHQNQLEMQNMELLRSQTTLEQSRNHYLDLYEFAPAGYLTLNMDGIILEINQTAAKFLGNEKSNIINRRFVSFIQDDYKDLWYRHYLMAKQAEGKYGCELPFQFKDSDLLYYHLDCLFTNEDKKSPPHMRITLTNVTERKYTETELRIAAAAFETQTGMVVADATKRILRVNKAFTLITGYSAEEATHLSFLDFNRQNIDRVKTIWDIVILDGYWEGEIWEQRKNGEFFPIWLTISSVNDKEGTLTHFVCSLSDFTERKHVETCLRVAAAAFETQSGIIVADADKSILRVNKAFTRITGYNDEESIGKSLEFLRSVLYDDGFYHPLWETVNQNGFWEGEIWEKHKNGKIFPVWGTITAVTDSENKITHYISSLIDITAQKKAEKVLIEARNRLQNQIATTEEELEKIKTETAEINVALNILLKHRETDKADAQLALTYEVEATVLPLLKKLKSASNGRHQSMRLIKILETNLLQLVKSYGRGANLATAYQKLTPIETQVAAMIRQGHSTKVIAAALNIANGTVSIHRKHIRRKLGLNGKSDNLYSYLQGLIE